VRITRHNAKHKMFSNHTTDMYVSAILQINSAAFYRYYAVMVPNDDVLSNVFGAYIVAEVLGSLMLQVH
jgi:hypothetical protein